MITCNLHSVQVLVSDREINFKTSDKSYHVLSSSVYLFPELEIHLSASNECLDQLQNSRLSSQYFQ